MAEDLTRAEMELRVLYAMLRPAVRLATRAGVPLRALGQWSELGYFHELRRQGLKMREISAQLEISMRKAAQLSRALKDSFFEADRHGLARRLEFMIWAEPLSLARMQQAMPDEAPEAVADALDALLKEGRVVEAPSHTVMNYAVSRQASRLVQTRWIARLDALNQLLDTVSGAIQARFFEDDPHALARNLQLRVRREDLPELMRLYEAHLWPHLCALDEAAASDPDAVAIDLAICWTPHAHVEALRRSAADARDEDDVETPLTSAP